MYIYRQCRGSDWAIAAKCNIQRIIDKKRVPDSGVFIRNKMARRVSHFAFSAFNNKWQVSSCSITIKSSLDEERGRKHRGKITQNKVFIGEGWRGGGYRRGIAQTFPGGTWTRTSECLNTRWVELCANMSHSIDV